MSSHYPDNASMPELVNPGYQPLILAQLTMHQVGLEVISSVNQPLNLPVTSALGKPCMSL